MMDNSLGNDLNRLQPIFRPVPGPAEPSKPGNIISLLSLWTISARQAALPGQLVSPI